MIAVMPLPRAGRLLALSGLELLKKEKKRMNE